MVGRITRLALSVFVLMTIFATVDRPVISRADTGSNWTGSYFSNRDLAGTPVFTRIDPAVVFNWGTNSPGPGLGSINWSARWITIQYLNAGVYRFTVTADDGVRVFVDGTLIMDAWREQVATTYAVDVQVAAGNHAIQVDYFQGNGNAQISVSWSSQIVQSTAWTAEYFPNPHLQGGPALTRLEGGIAYDWGLGAPDPSLPAGGFSARWTATIPFNAATYRFNLGGDDGVRLFIDNARVIDKWQNQPYTIYSIDVSLAAGLHTIRVEYYNAGGQAAVKLDYSVAVGPPPYPGTTSDQWYGEYFANPNLQGSPTFVRLDGRSGINFNWSSAAPAPNFPREYFSVRWTRYMFFPGRPYVFYFTMDDGVRFYIDSTLILDNWRPQSRNVVTRNVDLTEGFHLLRLEYYQERVESVVGMTWNPPNSQNPALSIAALGSGLIQPPPPQTGVGNGVVTGASVLNVRSGPGTAYEILGRLRRNDTFTVTGRNGDASWLRVTTAGLSGWLSSAYVTVSGNVLAAPADTPPPATQQGGTGVRAKLFSGLRLRNGPGTNYGSITSFGWGLVVDVVGRSSDNQWFQVQYGGLTGWIYSPYVRIVAGSLSNVPVVA